MIGHLSWRRLLLEWLLVTGIATLIASFTGHLLLCLWLSSCALLVWHGWQMLRLSHWLWSERGRYPPAGKGSWRAITHGIHRHRKQQQQQKARLASLISYFRRAAESAPDAVMVCDLSGHLLWCNAQAETLIGLKWPQDKGQLITNLIRQPEFIRYFQANTHSQPLTLVLTQNRYLECRLMAPYIDNTLLIIARDITRTHTLETLRQQFFADVSHELRIPLTVLQGYLELLACQKTKPSDMEQTAYQAMQEQVIRLNQLSTQLMTLTRLETLPVRQHQQLVNIPAIIQTLCDDFQRASLKPHHLKLAVDEMLMVPGDEDQLHSVITNLFFNAVEHNPPDTQIQISWQKISDHTARFTIQDNGPGIAPEHICRLTERFYRVDRSRSRQTGGSGLGLAIVKHALNHHGSVLHIESTPGKGSCFHFELETRPNVKNSF